MVPVLGVMGMATLLMTQQHNLSGGINLNTTTSLFFIKPKR